MDPNKLHEQERYLRGAFKAFLNNHAELLASFDRKQVADALTSYANLGNLDAMFEVEPGISAYLRFNEEAFLTLLDREAITPVTPLTQLGEEDLERMRRVTGIGVETLPAPPPKPPTADELLEAEVRQDFDKLPSAQMRAKLNGDRKYKAMYEKLVDTLGTTCSGFHDLGNLGG